MSAQVRGEGTRRVDILLVEDDGDLRDVLIDVLADAGYHAVGVGNGLEALHWLREARPLPSMILLDLMMPIMDGWRFREEQLKDPRLATIPVATLSATRNVEMKDVVHLKKPINMPALEAFAARNCHRTAQAIATSQRR